MNKTRYFELVAKEKALQAENSSLYDINKSEYSELTSYQTILQQQVFYDNRSQYIDLIQKCIDGEINCYAFQWDFFAIYYDHIKIYHKLIENLNQAGISSEISFYTDSKIKNFSLLIDELVPICEFLNEGLSERGFYRKMEKIYSNIQKYAESTS